MTTSPGPLPEKNIQKVARLLEESSLGTVGARQLRDRATSITVTRIRCRAYFATNSADKDWWESNQHNKAALLQKAAELADQGKKEISALLMQLAGHGPAPDDKSKITDALPGESSVNPISDRRGRIGVQDDQADWRSFRKFYESQNKIIRNILRDRTGLPEETASALMRQAMARAFDEWDKLVALDDPGEWVIGYALQPYRKFKLPDDDESWTHSEILATSDPPHLAAPSSLHECADVRITGALAAAVADATPEMGGKTAWTETGTFCGMTRSPDAGSAFPSFQGLYVAHFRPLVGMAILLILDTCTAKEIVQESFCSLYVAPSWFVHSEERALVYLRQDVVNRSRSVLRSRKVISRTASPLPGAEAEFPGTRRRIMSIERCAVLAAIESMPARQREAMVLRYYGDQSQSAIAKIMGVSEGSVRSYITGARAVLAEFLCQPQIVPAGEPVRAKVIRRKPAHRLGGIFPFRKRHLVAAFGITGSGIMAALSSSVGAFNVLTGILSAMSAVTLAVVVSAKSRLKSHRLPRPARTRRGIIVLFAIAAIGMTTTASAEVLTGHPLAAIIHSTEPPPAHLGLAIPVQIVFWPGQSRLSHSIQAKLGKWLDATQAPLPTGVITVTGHTAALGTSEGNRQLSLERAQIVADFFKSHGIPQSRLSVAGTSGLLSTERMRNRTVIVNVAFTSAATAGATVGN
jgi:RNA polymerase sigma factor (sigma-70 family)